MRATLAAAGQGHAKASDLNFAACGKRLSAQTYNILARIAEVDRLLRAGAGWPARVVEVHPEVSFVVMNCGRAITESKKTQAGHARRRALIDAAFGVEPWAAARAAVAPRDAADDDLADAFACLFTAERIARDRHVTLPDPPPSDSVGLPMRIVC